MPRQTHTCCRARALVFRSTSVRDPAFEVDGLNAYFFLKGLEFLHRRKVLFILELFFILTFTITTHIVCFSASKNLDGNSGNHAEPHERDTLQEEQGAQEPPLDTVVPADDTLGVEEGLEEMSEAVGGWEGPFDGAVVAAVTAVGDCGWNVGVD